MQMFARSRKKTFVNGRFQPIPIKTNSFNIYAKMCIFSQKILLRVIILCSYDFNTLKSVEAGLKSGMEYDEEVK